MARNIVDLEKLAQAQDASDAAAEAAAIAAEKVAEAGWPAIVDPVDRIARRIAEAISGAGVRDTQAILGALGWVTENVLNQIEERETRRMVMEQWIRKLKKVMSDPGN